MTDSTHQRSVIYISSSDEEKEEKEYEIVEIDDDDGSEADDSSDDEEEEEDEEYEAEEIDDDDDSEGDDSSGDEEEEEDGYEVEDIGGDEESDGDEDEEISGIAIDPNEDGDDDETLCEHVSSFLREGKDLEALSVNELKAYLRKHRIRLGGKKAVCVDRIREHWRLSKGNAESLYPPSSFVINCTGDVCKGDVVRFRQKIKKKTGNVIGMRTVAGRVLKESYGSARQQHTFTIEVLWSKGTKRLPPLFPLLVKGRNLYKLKTFRQRWNNEAERVQVLAEKHGRGTAARAIRAMKRSKQNQPAKKHLNEGRKDKKCFYSRGPSESSKGKQAYGHEKNMSLQHRKTNHHHQNVSSSIQLNLNENQSTENLHLNEGKKHQKCSYSRQPSESSKGKQAHGHKKNTSLQHRGSNNHHQNASSSRQPNLRENKRPNVGYSFITRGPNHRHLNMEMDTSLTVPWQMGFYNPNIPSHFSGHGLSSSPIGHQGFSYRYDFHCYQSNPNYHFDAERPFRRFS